MTSLLPRNKNGCPFLILAPMEGVADSTFRQTMARVGGFDEACTEFIRVPLKAHIPSLVQKYDPQETHPIPQAAQIMGGEPEPMAEMAYALEKRGAHRIDLNCGCPSRKVTGRGAGSSLLKDPRHLHDVAKAMVSVCTVPVTAKLRSGYEDLSLFEENLLAAEEAGVAYLTLHPRTKAEGYGPPARWDLIARAKELLSIPVVGNGDILSVSDAKRMLQETACDALMIGRGAVINPWIFHEIKAHYSGQPVPGVDLIQFLTDFIERMPKEAKLKSQLGKLKQLSGFLFKRTEKLKQLRDDVLKGDFESLESFKSFFSKKVTCAS